MQVIFIRILFQGKAHNSLLVAVALAPVCVTVSVEKIVLAIVVTELSDTLALVEIDIKDEDAVTPDREILSNPTPGPIPIPVRAPAPNPPSNPAIDIDKVGVRRY